MDNCRFYFNFLSPVIFLVGFFFCAICDAYVERKLNKEIYVVHVCWLDLEINQRTSNKRLATFCSLINACIIFPYKQVWRLHSKLCISIRFFLSNCKSKMFKREWKMMRQNFTHNFFILIEACVTVYNLSFWFIFNFCQSKIFFFLIFS